MSQQPPGTPRPSTAPPGLIYLIKQVELAARVRFEEILAPHGITATQYTALSVLARNPGMTSARLARSSFVRIQSMAQTMSALEALGYVSRQVDPTSRRQRTTSVTESGWALNEKLSGPVEDLEREMLQDLDPQEAAIFGEALRKARAALGGSHAV